MAKPTVYLETSVISYVVARPSRDVVVAGRQALTKEWWNLKRSAFDLVTSQTVVEEAAAGDPQAASLRLGLLEGVPLIVATEATVQLADALMRRLSLPSHVSADALHIAVATTSGVQFLLTWNCTHIANAVFRHTIEQVCRAHGFEPPVICTPEELRNV